MTAVDMLGFWFPLTGVLVLGLLWLLLRDTLRMPPGSDEGGGEDGGSDRAPRPGAPWSWSRSRGRPDAPARVRPRRRAAR